MHDDVLASLDRYLSELRLIREGLVSARSVRPGERRVALMRAVRTSERFQHEAARLLDDTTPGGCLCPAAGAVMDRAARACVHADETPALRG